MLSLCVPEGACEGQQPSGDSQQRWAVPGYMPLGGAVSSLSLRPAGLYAGNTTLGEEEGEEVCSFGNVHLPLGGVTGLAFPCVGLCFVLSTIIQQQILQNSITSTPLLFDTEMVPTGLQSKH